MQDQVKNPQMARHFEMWYAKQPEAFQDATSYITFIEILNEVQDGQWPHYKMDRPIKKYQREYAASKASIAKFEEKYPNGYDSSRDGPMDLS